MKFNLNTATGLLGLLGLIITFIVTTEIRFLDTTEAALTYTPNNTFSSHVFGQQIKNNDFTGKHRATDQTVENLKLEMYEQRIEFAEAKLHVLVAIPELDKHEYQRRETLRLQSVIDHMIRQIRRHNGQPNNG